MGSDKSALRDELVGILQREHATLVAAQQATSEGVIHEDNRPESDKDTRATEASYLARGQAARAAALERDVLLVRNMTLEKFDDSTPIRLSAIVTLEDERGARHVMLAPAGGGSRLTAGGSDVQVVTPPSPLGRGLLGARVGDLIELDRTGQEFEITAAY